MAMAVVYTNFAGQITCENRGGTSREYIPDPLGSTIALSSGTTITDNWQYWPYGEVLSRTGTNPTPFTFVGTLGYFKDLLDKLLYVRARHYQPNYGRWLTVDPLWPVQPPLSSVYGRPVDVTDPSGLGGWPEPLPPPYACDFTKCGEVANTRNTRWSNRVESVGQSFTISVGAPGGIIGASWTGTSRVVRADVMWTTAKWKCVCYSGCKDLVPYWTLVNTAHCKGTYLKEDIAVGGGTLIIREEYFGDDSPGCPGYELISSAGDNIIYAICLKLFTEDQCRFLK